MTAALLARLGFAIAAAVFGGFLLARALALRTATSSAQRETPNDNHNQPSQRQTWWLQAAVLGWCALWAVIWLSIALVRLRYPFELEWNGGAMRDHCERLLAGRSLYVAPGPDWFSYEYPPLYFWVSALLMRLLHDGSFASLRMVSILSTLGCCAILVLWVRRTVPGREGKTWGLIAAGIFLATYRFTGAWYDIERLDMLFLFLSLLGGYWLTRADSTLGIGWPDKPPSARPADLLFLALSAVAFWLSFLTKQQAILFLFGSAVALALRRQWVKLLLFSALSAALCLGSVILLNRATAGWFGYYCFHVPLANGIRLNLAAQYFTTDLPLYAPLIAVTGVLATRTRPSPTLSPTPHTGYPLGDPTPYTRIPISTIAWVLMGLVGSLLSRAHWGGDQNVLMAGYLGIILMASILAAQAQSGAFLTAAPLYLLALLQMLALVYRPDAQVPTSANRSAGERYVMAVRKLEREGEVLCLDHGAVTIPRHFQLMALMDVIGTEKGLPPTLLEALRSHRYAAILSDARPEPGGALDELSRDYQPTECLQIDTPWIATGFPTPAPGRTVWVLRPR